MNGILISFLVVLSGFGGGINRSDHAGTMARYFTGTHSLTHWLLLTQTNSDSDTPATPIEGTPIGGGGEQSWGALIVFAIGIAIFIISYLYFRNIPATKKKKKRHF